MASYAGNIIMLSEGEAGVDEVFSLVEGELSRRLCTRAMQTNRLRHRRPTVGTLQRSLRTCWATGNTSLVWWP